MALLSAKLNEKEAPRGPAASAVEGVPRAMSATRPQSRLVAFGARGGRKRVSKRDLLFITMQMAIMARAGIDVATALDSLARQSQSPALRELLGEIHSDVSSGIGVAEALRRRGDVFNETYVAVVAAGEASGKLPEVLGQLAQLQRGELRLANNIRTLLGYPILLAVVSALVLASLILFVLPNFADVFRDAEIPLPLITEILLAFGAEIHVRFWLWLPAAAVMIAAIVLALRSSRGKEACDRLFLRARLLGDVTRAILAGRAFRLLATMLDSGVPLLDALGLVRSSVRNRVVRRALATVQDDVLNGKSMASSLMATGVMPATAVDMIGMAERTGNMAMVARLVGEYFEEEGESRLRALVAMLEPVIVVCMGLAVAVVVLSVMLPMFDLVTLAQQTS